MHLSTTVRRLEEYALTGGLSIVTWNKRTPEPLPPYFESILDRIIHHANYKENTVSDVQWVIRKYLRFLATKDTPLLQMSARKMCAASLQSLMVPGFLAAF